VTQAQTAWQQGIDDEFAALLLTPSNPRHSGRHPGHPLLSDAIQDIHFYRTSEKSFGAFSNLFKRPIEFEVEKAGGKGKAGDSHFGKG